MPARALAAALAIGLIASSSLAAPAVIASCDAPAALRFAPGQNAGDANGGLPRGDLACWTLSARSGQTMTASVSSTGQNAVMQVYAPGWKTTKSEGDYHFAGRALKNAAEGDDATHWAGSLPVSGKYLFVLGTTSGGGDYDLHVSITGSK